MEIIENKYKEIYYLEAEKLLDTNAVVDYTQIHDKLWSIMVKDGDIYEAEILNPESEKPTCTCECAIFSAEEECAHIIVAQLFLRKHLSQQTEEEERQDEPKPKKKSTQTYNISYLLQHANKEELVDFIRGYARKDKSFNTMLKATFARRISLNDNGQKYKSVLNSLIKPISTSKNKSNSTDLRLGLAVIKEFISQIEDAISLNQFDDAVHILKSILQKMHYLLMNYNYRPEQVLACIETTYGIIDTLYAEKPSPELLLALDDLLESTFSKSYYTHSKDLDDLYLIAKKRNRADLLANMQDTLLHHKYRHTETQHVRKALIYTFSPQSLELDDDTAVRMSNYLLDRDETKTAISLLESRLSEAYRNKKVEIALINAYQADDNVEKILELASFLYVRYSDIKFYKMQKDLIPASQWPSVIKKIEAEIERQNPRADFVCHFYENENQPEKLLGKLRDENDLQLLMKFDYFLYKSHYAELEEIYCASVKSYLDSHGGHVASIFIEELFQHFNKIRAFKLERAIRSLILDEFDHRNVIASIA